MQVILITGTSHGLGLALAKLLAIKTNYRLVLTSRAESLPKLREHIEESSRIIIRPLDMLKPSEFDSLIKEVDSLWGGVDILINNAAVSYRAVLEHVEDLDEKMQMQTNYFAPRELTRLVLPKMKEKGEGKIINISSVGGMMAMPTMSSYSASKFALEGMSESLWYELKPFNISVTLIQLGFVNSDSFKRVILPPKSQNLDKEDIYGIYYEEMSKFISRMMSISRSTPESIALKILKHAINKTAPPLRISGTIDAIFFAILRRFLPRRLYHNLLYYSLPSSIRLKIKEWIKFLNN